MVPTPVPAHWSSVLHPPQENGTFLCVLEGEDPRVLFYRSGHWIRDGFLYDKRVRYWMTLQPFDISEVPRVP